MFGGGSIQLARLFGIRIGVDVSWFLVLFLIIWLLNGYYEELFPADSTKTFMLAVITAVLFFGSILLHELGHAAVAIRNGIPVIGIDLWMFGGVAKLERDTDSPGVEFRVAIAGPAVTFLIALVCFGASAAISGLGDVLDGTLFQDAKLTAASAVLAYLTAINVFVLVFNLIPGYPMDGGRLVRALVWWRTGDRNRSTRFAARMGRVVGWLVILYGVYVLLQDQLISGVWWAFIGMFLSQAARSAEAQAEFAGRIEHIRVADVMDAEPVAIPESMSLDQAEDDFFLRYGWPWFPVVDSAGRLVGVVSREALHSVDDAVRGAKPVGSVMARDDGESGLRARTEDPLEALLGLESLARLGAVMAVDADGVLRGVVTLEQVRRALKPAV